MQSFEVIEASSDFVNFVFIVEAKQSWLCLNVVEGDAALKHAFFHVGQLSDFGV